MESNEKHTPGLEIQILNDIKDAEKKAQDIVNKAIEEKEAIVHDAVIEASANFSKKSEEIRFNSEKQVLEFKGNAKLIREEKIATGKTAAKQLKAKAVKSKEKAVSYIMNKFEEMVNA